MKNFFSNKTNIILVVVLIVLLGAGGFFAYNVLKEPALKAIDFTNMSESEIIAWANENGCADKIEFKHEFDSTVKKDYVIYQSIKEGDEINDTIMIIISDGEDVAGKVEIPVSNFKTKDEIEAWFKDNNFINVTYEFVSDETKTNFEIISVEPTLAKPEDLVIVKVCQGTLVEVPDLSHYSDGEINTWSKENNIKVIFEYKTSESAKGAILSQSIKAGEKVSEGSSITLVISSGTSKTATIPATYLGIEEAKFIENLKNLGFTNLKKDEETYFSAISKKGTIFSYDDGTFPTTQVINYAISNGKYEFNDSDYNGLTLAKAKEKVEAYNKRNAHITLNTTDTSSDSKTKDTIYDCTSSFSSPNTTISCKYAKTGKDSSSEEETPSTNTTAYIDPIGYLGVSESSFVSSLKKLGFTNLSKLDAIYPSNTRDKGTICYYLPDGKQKTSTKIEYKVSLGTFSASNYNGKTKKEANNYVSSLVSSYGGSLKLSLNGGTGADTDILSSCSYSQSSNTVSCNLSKGSGSSDEPETPVTTKVIVPSISSNPCGSNNTSCSLNGLNYSIKYETNSATSGTILSVSPSPGSSVNEGTTVIVKISQGEAVKYIDTASSYRSGSLQYHTVEESKNYFKSVLGDFDLSFETETHHDYNTGTLISISVNGSTTYSAKDYPVSTEVVVKISSGLKN